jgi:ferredoxin
MTTVYRIEIDRTLCSGFGACVEEAENVFRLESGVALAAATSTDPRVLDAAAACPMGAISVTEVDDQAA